MIIVKAMTKADVLVAKPIINNKGANTSPTGTPKAKNSGRPASTNLDSINP